MRITLSFRVWDKKNNKYLDLYSQAVTNMGELLINDCSDLRYYQKVNNNDYEVEYCTGYKDIDGKYLYVNDYVSFQLGLKIVRARIIYDHFAFRLAEIRGGYMDFTQQKYTLLGNNNENPEIPNN